MLRGSTLVVEVGQSEKRSTTEERARLWDKTYTNRGVQNVSWYQEEAAVSLELIDDLGLTPNAAVVDVGGGASSLAERLVARGFTDVSVLDVSAAALAEARERAGDNAPIQWLHEDLLLWQPERRYDLWHDRAVFHFFVDAADRATYLSTLVAGLGPGGAVIFGTFAADGPNVCSGLPAARYTSVELGAMLGMDFELVESRREEHVTPAGAMQPFTWIAARSRHRQ